MAISDELTLLATTKANIKNSINAKGGSITNETPFSDYATAIDNLASGGDDSTLRDLIERDITSITIPSGTTRIGENAFNSCNNLTSISIPSSVTTIYSNAFSNCQQLVSITIPESVTHMLPSIFMGCTRLTSVNIPSGLTIIQQQTFYNCSSLTGIEIPSSVTSIGDSALRGCTSLTNVTIPSSVTSIGQRAFQGCTSLTNVSIGDSNTTIESNAFNGCSSLTSVTVNATTPPTLGIAVLDNTNNCPIYVPAASVDAYKAASSWSTYASRIYPIQQVATVDGNPVYNYDLGMTSTDTITSENMAKMPTGTNLELAEGIIWAGGATAFSNYTNLTLPSTFTTFGDQYMLDGLTTVTSKATTPPSAERNQIGGSSLTAIYVPTASVDTYKAAGGWSNHSSIIQELPVTSITFVEMNGDSSPYNRGDFADCETNTQMVDFIPSASGNSTFDFDIKSFGNVVVEDNYGNDVTSQCTFTSSDYYHWQESVNNPEFDPESEEDYYMWRLDTQINPGDSETPHSATITATYGNLTATFTINWTTTDNDCGGGD